jgi:hypothetical protein
MPSSTMLSRLLATKALVVIALTAGTTGGVALAATSTTGDQPERSTSTSSTRDASDDVSTDTATATAEATPTLAPTPDANGVGPVNAKGTPNPSVRGLCQARAAGATSNGGKAALNPAFQATAADDCAALVLPTSRGKAHATATATPTADPTPTSAPVAPTSDAKGNSASHRQSELHSNAGAHTGGSRSD